MSWRRTAVAVGGRSRRCRPRGVGSRGSGRPGGRFGRRSCPRVVPWGPTVADGLCTTPHGFVPSGIHHSQPPQVRPSGPPEACDGSGSVWRVPVRPWESSVVMVSPESWSPGGVSALELLVGLRSGGSRDHEARRVGAVRGPRMNTGRAETPGPENRVSTSSTSFRCSSARISMSTTRLNICCIRSMSGDSRASTTNDTWFDKGCPFTSHLPGPPATARRRAPRTRSGGPTRTGQASRTA